MEVPHSPAWTALEYLLLQSRRLSQPLHAVHWELIQAHWSIVRSVWCYLLPLLRHKSRDLRVEAVLSCRY